MGRGAEPDARRRRPRSSSANASSSASSSSGGVTFRTALVSGRGHERVPGEWKRRAGSIPHSAPRRVRRRRAPQIGPVVCRATLGAARPRWMPEPRAGASPERHRATSTARVSRITVTFTWPGILELILDLAGDLVREQRGRVVVDLARLDDHADLAAGLQRVHLRDAGLRRRDLLERLEPLDVVLEALAARARPRGGDRVGGDQQHGLDRLRLHLVVVRLDRVDDAVRLAVAAGELRGDERVRALDLVRHRLADVVEQRRALRRLHAGAELGGHDPRQVDDLERVLEDVLPVARAVAEPAEDLDELLVELAAVRLEDRLLPGLADRAPRSRPSTGSTSPRSGPGGCGRPRSASRASASRSRGGSRRRRRARRRAACRR